VNHIPGDVGRHGWVVGDVGGGQCPVGGEPVQPCGLELDADMDGGVVYLGCYCRFSGLMPGGGDQAR
jgi:hypothetical protein